MITQSVVAIVRTSPDTVIADYNRLLGLLLPTSAPHSDALLVAVIERQYPFPAESTPPWQLDGVAQLLRKRAYGQLRLQLTHDDPADRHALQPIARDLMLERALPLDRASAMAVLLSTLRRGPGTTYRGSTRLALAFARHRATLAVIDGTTIGNGPPNRASHPEIGNILIAAYDPVAADAIAVTLLGLNPLLDVAHLRIAHEQGIGIADLSRITLLGDHDLATQRWSAHAQPQHETQLSITTVAQQLKTRLQAFGRRKRRTADDFTNWTADDRERYTSWLYDTEWGQLFALYQRRVGTPTNAGARRSDTADTAYSLREI